MFTAELASAHTTVALPGASAVEPAGAQLVDVVTAAERARAGQLRCLDPHCDAALVYNNGSANAVGAMTRRPHWRHPAGSALDCAASGGPEGEWHQYVKLSILAAAESHELIVADGRARCDAVIRRKGGGTATAVEVQHSTIATAAVQPSAISFPVLSPRPPYGSGRPVRTANTSPAITRWLRSSAVWTRHQSGPSARCTHSSTSPSGADGSGSASLGRTKATSAPGRLSASPGRRVATTFAGRATPVTSSAHARQP